MTIGGSGLSQIDQPIEGLLEAWLTRKKLPTEPAALLRSLNTAIGHPDFAIEPSYLMTERVANEAGLERIWRTAILPLLQEHFFGEGRSVEAEFGLAALGKMKSIPAAASPSEPSEAQPLANPVTRRRRMSVLELAAWSSVTAIGMTEADIRALAASGAVDVSPGWDDGTWQVRAGSQVGVLRACETEVRILPRITIARLIYLLGYAQDPKAWTDDPVGLDDMPDLWPAAMAQVFVRQAEKATERGVLQGYRTEETAQLVMRRRLREADQLRVRAGLAIPLEVRYDEYDVDIAENQVLRAAACRYVGATSAVSPVTLTLSTVGLHTSQTSERGPASSAVPVHPESLADGALRNRLSDFLPEPLPDTRLQVPVVASEA